MDACLAGADMIGVVVDTPSPRCVTPVQARTIFAVVPEPIARVAVMTPRDVAHAIHTVCELQPDCLQVHGYMSATELGEIKMVTGVQLIAAVNVPQQAEQPEEIVARAQEVAKIADFILTDTKPKSCAGGGTGLTHDWSVSRLIRETIDKPLILSGGLNPVSVKRAIKAVGPHGVDVASGVESVIGKKDPELVRKFIENARG